MMDILNVAIAFGIPAYVIGLLAWKRWKPIIMAEMERLRVERNIERNKPQMQAYIERKRAEMLGDPERFEPASPTEADDDDDEGETDDLPPPPPSPSVPVAIGRVASWNSAWKPVVALESPMNWLEILLDRVVHLMVLGGTGAGKTYFLHHVAQSLRKRGQVVVCDPDAAAGDWPGCEVYGAGDDFAAIDRALAGIGSEARARRTARADGVRSFDPLYVIIEEYSDVQAECTKATPVVENLLRRARKLNIHVLIGVQDSQVKTLGWERKSALLTNVTELTIELDAEGRRRARCNGATYAIPNLEPVVVQVQVREPVSYDPQPAPNHETQQFHAENPEPETQVAGESATGPEEGGDEGKDDAIAALLAQGWSYSRIIRALSVSTARIARVRKERLLEKEEL